MALSNINPKDYSDCSSNDSYDENYISQHECLTVDRWYYETFGWQKSTCIRAEYYDDDENDG